MYYRRDYESNMLRLKLFNDETETEIQASDEGRGDKVKPGEGTSQDERKTYGGYQQKWHENVTKELSLFLYKL